MARPNKIGLDYFPFDVDFFEDEKIIAISGEFGIKGEITVIKLLCAIYRNGYFILWNDLLKYKLLRNLPGVSPELIDSIVNRLVLWGFFDKALFDSVEVLTSKGIQKRYFEASKRRKATGDLPYLLIDEVCGCVDKDIHSSVDGVKDARSNVSGCGVNVYNNSSSGDEETSSTNGENPEISINVCNNGVNVYNNPVSDDINVNKNTTKKRKVKKINNPPIIPPLESGDAVANAPDAGETADVKIGDDTKTWRNDYATYLRLVEEAKNALLQDREMMAKQQSYYPGVNIPLSIEKACTNYWATEAGWKNKKGKRSKEINMKMTLVNAIKNNRVYETNKTESQSYDNGGFLD